MSTCTFPASPGVLPGPDNMPLIISVYVGRMLTPRSAVFGSTSYWRRTSLLLSQALSLFPVVGLWSSEDDYGTQG